MKKSLFAVYLLLSAATASAQTTKANAQNDTNQPQLKMATMSGFSTTTTTATTTTTTGFSATQATVQPAAAGREAETPVRKLRAEKGEGIFNHLDIGITLGSTGVGVELSSPIGPMVRMRAGATYIPHFTKALHYDFQIGSYTPDPNLSDKENAILEQKMYQQRFEKLNSLLYSMMSMKVDDNVTVDGEPSFNNAKILFDVMPFKDKRWHFTAGVYISDRRIAKARNTAEATRSLVALNAYNNMYYKACGDEPMIEYGDIWVYNPEISKKFLNYGEISAYVGRFKHDVYATEKVYYTYSTVDPVWGDPIKETVIDKNGNPVERAMKKGELRYDVGDRMFSAGDAYRMLPDEECMVRANAYANAVKPYVGFGYGGFIDRYQRTKLSVDCGVMFWGGRPSVITHDGVDLVRDLYDLNSSVDRYVKIVKALPVYPVIELKISQRIF